MPKVGMAELIREVGDDHLFFQNLDDVAIDFALKKVERQTLTKISFLTDAITPTEVMNGTTERIGLVVWLPRARVKEILGRAEAADHAPR